MISLEMAPYPEGVRDPRKKVAHVVYRVPERPRFQRLTVCLACVPIQDYETDHITKRESLKLILIRLVVQAVLLCTLCRGVRAVVSPVLVVSISILYTMGIIGLTGWSVSIMIIMLPVMLFSICLGDVVHIVTSLHRFSDPGYERHKAMAHMLHEVMIPCLFTSLTTMMGFLSFLVTDIVPIRMAGVYSAIGVVLAFLLAIVLTPILYPVFPEHGGNMHEGPLGP